MKRTFVVAGGPSMDALRLEAARGAWHGADIRLIEHVAARMAGGFLRPVDTETLTQAATDAIRAASATELGDLHRIADLPGLPGALVGTLVKTWHSGIDLAKLAAARPDVGRLTALAGLEAAILARLPHAMLRPPDLVRRGLERMQHAPAVLGPVEFRFLTDLDPCWRPLVLALATRVDVVWNAGAREVPAWVQAAGLRIVAAPAAAPERRAVTCATARHEVIEALRWARSLLATGTVQAEEIAFAAAAPGEFDDLFLAMSRDANLDIHFGHGRRALATRDGQAAAALADLLLHGLSQDRVRRLAGFAAGPATPFGRLPEGWGRSLPRSAPLASYERWEKTLAARHAPGEVTEILLPAIRLLAQGTISAAEAGETFLQGGARALWRRALARAPASALQASLAALREPDGVEPGASILWTQAADLAACPRPYVWLLGLNARLWPRGSAEDPLLPSHLVASADLDPIPVTKADRAAYHAIGLTTGQQLVCSASRRDAGGRLLGLSPLMPDASIPLRRARVPEHAMSEQDRMMARPDEFATTARAQSALACWRDWNTPDVTAHDGLVRANHPVLLRAMDRVHSASSLRKLLRNPLGFAWQYALGWREPDIADDTINLDAMQFGSLVHDILEAALGTLERAGGLAAAASDAVATAIHAARDVVRQQWEAEYPLPPRILWNAQLQQAEQLAVKALSWNLASYPGQRSHAEVAFGDQDAPPRTEPWDVARPVTVPGTDLHIRGRIDRLDLAAGGTQARVIDYKTGKPGNPEVLDGGKELQRCLYASAVRALLGSEVAVEAGRLYPRGDAASYRPLADTEAALRTLTEALILARDSLRAGHAVPGPDTNDAYDDLRFALPASTGALTDRKKLSAKAMLGDAALIWDAP